MNSAIETISLINNLSNISDFIPGIKISAYTDADYGMVKLCSLENREVVIFDLKSAVGGGMEALKKSKLSENNPFIIIVTGLNNEDFKNRCFRHGADYFFDKKDDLKEINNLLTKYLQRGKNFEHMDIEYV